MDINGTVLVLVVVVGLLLWAYGARRRRGYQNSLARRSWLPYAHPAGRPVKPFFTVPVFFAFCVLVIVVAVVFG